MTKALRCLNEQALRRTNGAQLKVLRFEYSNVNWMLTSILSTRMNRNHLPSARSNHSIRGFSSLAHHESCSTDYKTSSNDNNCRNAPILYPTNQLQNREVVQLPHYLKKHYWWAYINPTMISLLDRKWLVDIVLWGNFTTLRNAAIQELVSPTSLESQSSFIPLSTNELYQRSKGGGEDRGDSNCSRRNSIDVTRNNHSQVNISSAGNIPRGQKLIYGSTLQISCVYADLTETIAQHLAPAASLDVIDVVPDQLINLQHKLHRRANRLAKNNSNNHDITSHSDNDQPQPQIILSCCDATKLYQQYPHDNVFDNIVIFFLLHETPDEVRRQLFSEACRLCKVDSGRIIIIDYHQPNPSPKWISYVMQYMYRLYEPFAIDLWNSPITHWLPKSIAGVSSLSPVQSNVPIQLHQYQYTLGKPMTTYFHGLYQKVVITKHRHTYFK